MALNLLYNNYTFGLLYNCCTTRSDWSNKLFFLIDYGPSPPHPDSPSTLCSKMASSSASLNPNRTPSKSIGTMSVADASSCMVPSTPASSSMASSEVSTIHSPVQMNIWTLFRLPVGSEQTHIVQNVGTKRHKKVLHYCLSCERQKVKPIWSSAYTGNAKEHVQKVHRAEWKEWSRNHGNSLRTDGPNQASIDRYMQPVGVHSSRHLTLRQAFDKPRFIKAFISVHRQLVEKRTY